MGPIDRIIQTIITLVPSQQLYLVLKVTDRIYLASVLRRQLMGFDHEIAYLSLVLFQLP